MAMTQSNGLKVGMLTYISLLGIGIWTWVISFPRTIMKFIMSSFDLFESTMLSILWDYQGDNIIKFLFKHHFIQPEHILLDHKETRASDTRTKSTQTDIPIVDKQKMNKNALMEKVLDDVLPALLEALHSIPQKHEFEQMANNLVAQKINENKISDTTDMLPAMQVLSERVDNVGRQVSEILSVLETSGTSVVGVDERLKVLADALGEIKSKYQNDSQLVTKTVKELEKLDANLETTMMDSVAVLQSSDEIAKTTADACVWTDEYLENRHSESIYSDLATKFATPVNQEILDQQETYSENSEDTDDVVIQFDKSKAVCFSLQPSTRQSDESVSDTSRILSFKNDYESSIGTGSVSDPIPFADKISDDALTNKKYNLDIVPHSIIDRPIGQKRDGNKNGLNTNSVPVRSKRFSLRNQIKRRSWFGRKDTVK